MQPPSRNPRLQLSMWPVLLVHLLALAGAAAAAPGFAAYPACRRCWRTGLTCLVETVMFMCGLLSLASRRWS